jgi:hypothetical protein
MALHEKLAELKLNKTEIEVMYTVQYIPLTNKQRMNDNQLRIKIIKNKL